MERTYILTGPQGIGKSAAAKRLATLLGCSEVIDEWDGVSPLPGNALATSNAIGYYPPAGAVVFSVMDAEGVSNLIAALSGSTPGSIDRLAALVKARREPFTLEEAAEALGKDPGEITPNTAIRLGSALRKLGCKPTQYRPPYATRTTRGYTPPTDETPTTLAGRWKSDVAEIGALSRAERARHIAFIGTTNEHEMLGASCLMNAGTARPVHGFGQRDKRFLHDLPCSPLNFRLVVERLKHLTKPVVEHFRRLLGK